MNREQNEAALKRVVVAQALEIVALRDRLAGSQEARNAAEKGLARLRGTSGVAGLEEELREAKGTLRAERTQAQADADLAATRLEQADAEVKRLTDIIDGRSDIDGLVGERNRSLEKTAEAKHLVYDCLPLIRISPDLEGRAKAFLAADIEGD